MTTDFDSVVRRFDSYTGCQNTHLILLYKFVIIMSIVYKNCILAKNSQALELYNTWKKSGESKDRKKLDDHMKELERKYQESIK